MTKGGKVASALVLAAAVIAVVLARAELQRTTDPLNVLAIPFLLLYAVLAIVGIVFVDYLFRTVRRAWRAWQEIEKSS